jgi:hypothetical protein
MICPICVYIPWRKRKRHLVMRCKGCNVMALQIVNNFPYISQVALHLTILFFGFYIKRKLYQLLGNY